MGARVGGAHWVYGQVKSSCCYPSAPSLPCLHVSGSLLSSVFPLLLVSEAQRQKGHKPLYSGQALSVSLKSAVWAEGDLQSLMVGQEAAWVEQAEG